MDQRCGSGINDLRNLINRQPAIGTRSIRCQSRANNLWSIVVVFGDGGVVAVVFKNSMLDVVCDAFALQWLQNFAHRELLQAHFRTHISSKCEPPQNSRYAVANRYYFENESSFPRFSSFSPFYSGVVYYVLLLD